MASYFGNKELKPIIYFGNKKIKYMFNGSKEILTSQKQVDINSLFGYSTYNATDNTSSTSKSIVSYDCEINEAARTITISNLQIAPIFAISTTGTKEIRTNVMVANEHIYLNGTDDASREYSMASEYYFASIGDNVPCPISINANLVFYIDTQDNFNMVLEELQKWVN